MFFCRKLSSMNRSNSVPLCQDLKNEINEATTSTTNRNMDKNLYGIEECSHKSLFQLNNNKEKGIKKSFDLSIPWISQIFFLFIPRISRVLNILYYSCITWILGKSLIFQSQKLILISKTWYHSYTEVLRDILCKNQEVKKKLSD